MKIEFEIDLDNYTEITKEIYEKLTDRWEITLIRHKTYIFVVGMEDYDICNQIEDIHEPYFIIDEFIQPTKYFVIKDDFQRIDGSAETLQEWLDDQKEEDIEKQIEKEINEFKIKRRKELGL